MYQRNSKTLETELYQAKKNISPEKILRNKNINEK